jgi:hypothetical protein
MENKYNKKNQNGKNKSKYNKNKKNLNENAKEMILIPRDLVKDLISDLKYQKEIGNLKIEAPSQIRIYETLFAIDLRRD